MKTRLELLKNKGYWTAFLEGMKHSKESDEKIAEEIISRIESLSKTTPIQAESEKPLTASYFFGWFKDQHEEEFIARVIDTTNTASWRIDGHDKSFFLALPSSFIREATQEEITMHINRKS